jgi:hypothetical protein
MEQPKKTAKSATNLEKNFPRLPDIVQESLDIGRDMVKMAVVLSSAKQAGAVALETRSVGLPPRNGFVLGDV